MAKDLKDNLPLEVVQLLSGDSWKGGPLVAVRNPLGHPPATMLGKNFVWLKPFVTRFPNKAWDDQRIMSKFPERTGVCNCLYKPGCSSQLSNS